MHVWGQGHMEVSVPSSQFCCGAKTVLGGKKKKKKSLKKYSDLEIKL